MLLETKCSSGCKKEAGALKRRVEESKALLSITCCQKHDPSDNVESRSSRHTCSQEAEQTGYGQGDFL